MQKDMIIQKLKAKGCRITKQRQIILDIILEQECSCCKEIYYRASLQDKKIGFATVYRMVNTLEEIGAISRKNMYRIMDDTLDGTYEVKLDDDTLLELSAGNWRQIVETGLEQCGYMNGRTVRSIMAK